MVPTVAFSAVLDGEAYPGKTCRGHMKRPTASQTRALPSCLSVSTGPGARAGPGDWRAGWPHGHRRRRGTWQDENVAWMPCAFGSIIPCSSGKGPEPSSLCSRVSPAPSPSCTPGQRPWSGQKDQRRCELSLQELRHTRQLGLATLGARKGARLPLAQVGCCLRFRAPQPTGRKDADRLD